MDKDKSFVVGIFEHASHFDVLLHTLVTSAGYQEVSCSTESQTLATFLQAMIERLTQTHVSPYDVLILVASALELDGHTRTLLKQLVAFELLPVVLFTDAPCCAQKPFFFRVGVTPFLSRSLFSPQAFAEAMETATGVTFSFSETAARTFSQWHREQLREAIQTHQTWIDLRQKWLEQRQEWIIEQQTWLSQQRAWIDHQQKQPEPQEVWLQEQQAWLGAQQEEARQQKQHFHFQRHWLTQQQRKLDRFKMAMHSRTRSRHGG
jgi:hypothetical protein